MVNHNVNKRFIYASQMMFLLADFSNNDKG